ncbi:MAG: lipopolysaccharide heptosyltransferase 1, partial [Gammaproteobacteria bacterium]|nr:lipopolysaccharide heptosyltransferase 1 [Gammaproteobacteria bacterium]
MRVLLVKTSSLGDLIHSFPAISDAGRALPGIRFDWLVEKSFAEVPAWHPAVAEVIPIALRRWRRDWRKVWRSGELKAFRARLRETRYDLVLDAQGLIKSALPAFLARGPRAGLD